jgi:rhodanese-related sulfurtransferase
MKEITAKELRQKLAAGEKLYLVDVREPYEHEEFDIGGINIPLAEIPFNIQALKEMRDKDIVLYCRSGNRSAMAQRLLALQFGIQNTINLQGGMVSWQQLDL